MHEVYNRVSKLHAEHHKVKGGNARSSRLTTGFAVLLSYAYISLGDQSMSGLARVDTSMAMNSVSAKGTRFQPCHLHVSVVPALILLATMFQDAMNASGS